MKVRLEIELEDGTILKGEASLEKEIELRRGRQSNLEALHEQESGPATSSLNFKLPIRVYISRYATGKSGSKRFTLLLAYLVQGQLDNPIDRSIVIEHWSKMTGLLKGKFNGAHEQRAKDAGWIYSGEVGKIALYSGWEEALK